MSGLSAKTKVLFISGAGRSGTTLLNRLLGQLPGFFACGELNYIWDAGFGRNQLCACGARLRDCSFWSSVAHTVVAQAGEKAFGTAAALRQRVGFRNQVLRLMYPQLQSRRFRDDLVKYRDLIQALFAEVQARSGARVIIDSSKDPAHGLVLRGIESLDVRVLHLVRSPHAVAYSRTRAKQKTSMPERQEFMPKSNPAKTAIKWVAINRITSTAFADQPGYIRIRYEDLVESPEETLRKIASFAGEPDADTNFLNGSEATMERTHTALGNPSKADAGIVHIRPDDEWRNELGPWARLAVSIFTVQSASKFGYTGHGYERR